MALQVEGIVHLWLGRLHGATSKNLKGWSTEGRLLYRATALLLLLRQLFDNAASSSSKWRMLAGQAEADAQQSGLLAITDGTEGGSSGAPQPEGDVAADMADALVAVELADVAQVCGARRALGRVTDLNHSATTTALCCMLNGLCSVHAAVPTSCSVANSCIV